MKHLCIYHNADLDGKCSAAIAMRYLTQAGSSVELLGINYGEPFPWERVDKDTAVVMLDFSIQPFEGMLELNRKAGSFTWIDHHSSAIVDYEAQDVRWTTKLRTDQAACELTWEHYHGADAMPKSVYWLGRYDIWMWKGMKDVLEFQYGLRSVQNGPTDAIWDALLIVTMENNRVADSLVDAGRHILRYNKLQDDIYAKATCFEIEWHGLRFIASNAQLTNSALFDSVFNPEKHDAMMTFGYRKGKWTVSMYAERDICNIRGFHLGEIAKEYGGGGHPGAAGFQCLELPFPLPTQVV
jgi:oligoribonuclease NrnB/cAMP/cGMP phosphodiesterase (DHH superfamily)